MSFPDVWMIISSFYPHIGGAERQAQQLAERLVLRGWRVNVLTRRHNPRYPYLPPTREDINGVPIRRVYSRAPSKLAALLFVLGGLWHLRRSGPGRLYYAHDLGTPALLGILAKLFLGGRCLVKIRSGQDRYNRQFRSLGARLQFWALRYAMDYFVAVSQEGVDMLVDHGIPKDKIAHIPNGVDMDLFYPATLAEKEHARRRLGLPLAKSIVIYVGRLVPVKGVDILLNAWSRLSPTHRNQALLLIVGVGQEEGKLLRFAQERGLQESVLFVGRQERVLDCFHAADLFVLPSRCEGLSNALLEAMACGLPVICSAVGGALDLIQPGKAGRLFAKEDDIGLAQALAGMLEASDHWEDMGNTVRQVVQQRASLSSNAESMVELYNTIQ